MNYRSIIIDHHGKFNVLFNQHGWHIDMFGMFKEQYSQRFHVGEWTTWAVSWAIHLNPANLLVSPCLRCHVILCGDTGGL